MVESRCTTLPYAVALCVCLCSYSSLFTLLPAFKALLSSVAYSSYTVHYVFRLFFFSCSLFSPSLVQFSISNFFAVVVGAYLVCHFQNGRNWIPMKKRSERTREREMEWQWEWVYAKYWMKWRTSSFTENVLFSCRNSFVWWILKKEFVCECGDAGDINRKLENKCSNDVMCWWMAWISSEETECVNERQATATAARQPDEEKMSKKYKRNEKKKKNRRKFNYNF